MVGPGGTDMLPPGKPGPAVSATTDTTDRIVRDGDAQESERLLRVPFGLIDWPALVVFWGLFAVVFLQFFSRYVLNSSVSWTEEAARYLLILLAFVGSIRCQTRGSHICLEFIDGLFPGQVGKLKLFALLASAGFFAVVFYSAWTLAVATSFQNMVSLPFPKYYLYILIMVALVVNLLVHVRDVVRMVRKQDSA